VTIKKNGKLNSSGTVKKSQMLYDMHPDVTKIVFRYGRWHHFVDYTPFKSNKLRLKKNAFVPTGVNNYGMKLITDYNNDNPQ
jgi:hypothetical protein